MTVRMLDENYFVKYDVRTTDEHLPEKRKAVEMSPQMIPENILLRSLTGFGLLVFLGLPAFISLRNLQQ